MRPLRLIDIRTSMLSLSQVMERVAQYNLRGWTCWMDGDEYAIMGYPPEVKA